MTKSRVAVVVTCLAVAALGVWLAVATWDQANKTAVIASALAAVAAVGVAVWAGFRSGGSRSGLVARNTGNATAGPGGRANTGVRGAGKPRSAEARRTGDARAGRDGDANSGVEG